LDEVFVKIRGERYYLWRAVDRDGDVIEILVQRYRHALASLRQHRVDSTLARDDVTLRAALSAQDRGIFMRLFDRRVRACECTRTLLGFIPEYAEVAWGDE
jgi:hypothetical protein